MFFHYCFLVESIPHMDDHTHEWPRVDDDTKWVDNFIGNFQYEWHIVNFVISGNFYLFNLVKVFKSAARGCCRIFWRINITNCVRMICYMLCYYKLIENKYLDTRAKLYRCTKACAYQSHTCTEAQMQQGMHQGMHTRTKAYTHAPRQACAKAYTCQERTKANMHKGMHTPRYSPRHARMRQVTHACAKARTHAPRHASRHSQLI